MSWIDKKIEDEKRKKIEAERQAEEHEKEKKRKRRVYYTKIGSFNEKIQGMLEEANKELSRTGKKLSVDFNTSSILIYSNENKECNFIIVLGYDLDDKVYLKFSGRSTGSTNEWEHEAVLDNITLENFNKEDLLTMMGIISGDIRIRRKNFDTHFLHIHFPNLIFSIRYIRKYIRYSFYKYNRFLLAIVFLFIIPALLLIITHDYRIPLGYFILIIAWIIVVTC